MEDVGRTETKRLQNTVEWLEETVQQNNQRIGQLQQQLEQAISLVRAQGERLRALEESNRAGNTHMSRLPRLEEELRQVRDRLEQVRQQRPILHPDWFLGHLFRLPV